MAWFQYNPSGQVKGYKTPYEHSQYFVQSPSYGKYSCSTFEGQFGCAIIKIV